MGLPFLSLLNINARLAYPIIRRGVREGLSGRAIAGTLRGSGYKISTQTLYDIIRAEKRLQSLGSQLKFMAKNAIPNPNRLPEALTPMRRNYAFDVRVDGVITQTSEATHRYVTVTTDALMSRAQIEEIARDMVEGNPDSYPIEITGVQLEHGKRAGELGTL